jgi:hypothetical protein
MQFHERADDGKSKARAAMLRAERVAFEAAEDALLKFGWNAGPVVRHAEYDSVAAAVGGKRDRLARRRKSGGIRQKIEQRWM